MVLSAAGGKDVEVTVLVNGDYQTDKSLADGIVQMMEPLGIRVILNTVDGKQRDALAQAGKFDWMVLRNGEELTSVVQKTVNLAPVGPQTAAFHRAGKDGQLDLLPFEQQIVDVVNKFIASSDNAERKELMKQFQKLYTDNVYGIGLVQYPGALIINKRFANIPKGTPINLFNWAEDSIIRERVFVPTDKQGNYELHAETLPGAPGSAGPVKN